jgi:hypothetical protein
MNGKMKDCFTAHSMMHSLIGLGLGVFLVSLIPGLAMAWLGLVLIVVGIVWDMMRK